MHEEAGIFGGLWKQNSHFWAEFAWRYCPVRRRRPKFGSFERSLLKREVFRKKRPSPILREPFEDSAPPHSCWQFGNEFPTREWNSLRRRDRQHLCWHFQRMNSVSPFSLLSCQFIYNWKSRDKHVAQFPMSEERSLRHWLQRKTTFWV